MADQSLSSPIKQPISIHVTIHWIHLLILLSAALSVYTLWEIPKRGWSDDFTLPLVTWGVSVVILLVALYLLDRTRQTFQSIFDRWDWILFGWLAVMAFALRFWHISSIPFTMSGDEASQGIETIHVLNKTLRNPFATAWYSVPSMNFFFNSLFMAVIPDKFIGLRLPYALCGSLSVGGAYLLVRQMTGRRLALFTALLTLVYHYHIHFSRLGSHQILDPFFMVFAFLTLYRGLSENRFFYLGLSGVLTGLAMYFYAGARLTLLVICGIFIFLTARSLGKFVRQNWKALVIFFLAFLIAGAPMLQFAVRSPDEFNARVNQVGILQSGWFKQEVELLNSSQVAILWEQFYRSFFSFTYYQDRTVWYGLRQPLLDPISSVLLIFGVLYATIAVFKNQKLLPFVGWWWGGILLGSMLTESPPSSQRLVTLIVPSLFFIALALDRIIQALYRAIPRLHGNLLYYIFLMVFAFNSLYLYFMTYTPQRIFGGGPAEAATILAPIINQGVFENPVYLLPDEYTNTEFPTWTYLFEGPYTLLKEPLTFPLQEKPFPSQQGALFIAFPSRYAELEQLRQQYPGGESTLIQSPGVWENEFMLYKIPPNQE